MNTVLHVDGEAPNLLTDLRDIGSFVMRIVEHEGTANRYVFASGSMSTKTEIYSIWKKRQERIRNGNFGFLRNH
jgi:hypothetical protein